LMSFLTGKLSLEEESAKKATKKIINERKFLFRNLISGLLDKNLDAIQSLEADMSRVTRRYHDLNVALEQAPAEEVEEDEGDSELVDELKEEVKSLKKEIHITLTTLNNIFSEFSSMFGEEVPESEMSVDQIITAMEAFSGKSGDEEAVELEAESMAEEEPAADEPDAFAEVDEALEDIATEEQAVEASQEAAAEESLDNPAESGESALEALDAVDDQGDVFDASEPLAQETEIRDEPIAEEMTEDTVEEADQEQTTEQEPLDFSIDDELDDIDSALDELELGSSSDSEPSWDDAFEESGDSKE